MIILKITINGNLYLADNSLNYDHIHKLVNDNTYDSIGEAISSKITDAVHHTEWFQHTPQNFDLFKDNQFVNAYCGNDLTCLADSANWTIMNKTELTADIYKFITHRVSVVKTGFRDNFIPDHVDFHAILDLIDWHFLLDCVCWFF